MGKKFTAENAREMQRRGAEKRKANTLERKSAKAIVDALLSTTKKNKNGQDVTYKEIMLQAILKGAIEMGDLRKVEFLLKLVGEAPDNTTRVDVTTNGKDVTAPPKIVFKATPLTEKDLAEIQDIENGRQRSMDNTSVQEAEDSL